jgi:6-phosphogluconolactonase (cycloisomerase 2 family)
VSAVAAITLASGAALVGPAQASGYDGQTVYTLSNATDGNQVLAFHRTPAGGLERIGTFDTGGSGTGGGLGSQGAVALDRHADRLLAVNAGSNTVSLFSVSAGGRLRLVDSAPSGGERPISVTMRGHVAYVLNGGSNTISGLRVDRNGLDPIIGSTRSLGGSGGAQVSFTPEGRQLVVTEKATNTIDVFPVDWSGRAGTPVTNPSSGQTPFGFAFGREGRLVVSNAAGGAPDASSVTTYRVGRDNRLTVLDGPVALTESAACWVVTSGRYAYTTNTASGTVSGLRIGAGGHATLLSPDGVSASTGLGPIDADVDQGDLFTLNSGSHTITVHGIGRDGSLTAEGAIGELPASAVGLAVR